MYMLHMHLAQLWTVVRQVRLPAQDCDATFESFPTQRFSTFNRSRTFAKERKRRERDCIMPQHWSALAYPRPRWGKSWNPGLAWSRRQPELGGNRQETSYRPSPQYHPPQLWPEIEARERESMCEWESCLHQWPYHTQSEKMCRSDDTKQLNHKVTSLGQQRKWKINFAQFQMARQSLHTPGHQRKHCMVLLLNPWMKALIKAPPCYGHSHAMYLEAWDPIQSWKLLNVSTLHVETCSMPRAPHAPIAEVTLRQRGSIMRALVPNGRKLSILVYD